MECLQDLDNSLRSLGSRLYVTKVWKRKKKKGKIGGEGNEKMREEGRKNDRKGEENGGKEFVPFYGRRGVCIHLLFDF